MFVTDSAKSEDRSFSFAFPMNDKWGQAYHHVAGILEIYMELDSEDKRLDFYVLSTGGYDSATSKARPVTWPSRAYPTETEWESSGYGKYVLYVSRASWKLNNIPKDFKFSYKDSENS